MNLDAIASLEESPLFNLSLSSKELFHSNFLEWLWKKYPVAMHNVFKGKLTPGTDTSGNVIVSREDRNLDLTIKYESGYQIVIENKVKSLPYIEQLRGYSAKFNISGPKVDFVLLSMTKPSFIDNDVDLIMAGEGAIWRWMSYEELSKGLRNFQPENEYHRHLLEDYLLFVENMSTIIRSYQIDWESDQVFFKPTEPIAKLRINDLVQKLNYSGLAEQVKKTLDQEVLSLGDWDKGKAGQIYLGSGITRSMGFFDIRYVIEDMRDGDKSPSIVGIQLQGRSLRLFFEVNTSEGRAGLIAKKLLAQGKWFDLNRAAELKTILKEYPKDPYKFNNFSKSFYYRSKNLANDISAKTLVTLIAGYCNYIESKLPEYTAIIAGN
jgi:hypothetical protein